MEKRIIIFTDSACVELGRTVHDSSILKSLPEIGHTVVDMVTFGTNLEEKRVVAKVKIVEHNYVDGIVYIYAAVM